MFEIKLNKVNLLRRAVSPLVHLGVKAVFNCSVDCFWLQTSDEKGWDVTAIQIGSSCFHGFSCDSYYCLVGVNLNELNTVLSTIGDEDSLTITYNTEQHSNFICLTFEDTTGSGFDERSYMEMMMFDIPLNQVIVDITEYEFEVVVGIPSWKFRNSLRLLSNYAQSGPGLYYSSMLHDLPIEVSVTATQVKLDRLTEVVYEKERGECIIGGAGDNTLHFDLSFDCIQSYLEASNLSDTVWMFCSHNGPAMLNIPIWPLGNIVYRFWG
ncbi:unnamed protein product [Ilex paraguariensis]|uniref:Proliferating cell nuclear antigen PCNA N-terminal domain-containing protein n=1 Tax=Ilex paraguariensis TaxID=185542 RepID=A0ABC8UG96_9AQUA